MPPSGAHPAPAVCSSWHVSLPQYVSLTQHVSLPGTHSPPHMFPPPSPHHPFLTPLTSLPYPRVPSSPSCSDLMSPLPHHISLCHASSPGAHPSTHPSSGAHPAPGTSDDVISSLLIVTDSEHT